MPVYFDQTPQQEVDDILQINIHGTLAITKLVLPFMLAKYALSFFYLSFVFKFCPQIQEERFDLEHWLLCGRNPLSHVGHLLRQQGIPRGLEPRPRRRIPLQGHHRSTRQRVLRRTSHSFLLCPPLHQPHDLLQVSAMSKIRRPNLTTPTPKAYVRSVLGHLQLPCGSIVQPFSTTPYWSHAVADWFINVLNWPSVFVSYTHGTDIRFLLPAEETALTSHAQVYTSTSAVAR